MKSKRHRQREGRYPPAAPPAAKQAAVELPRAGRGVDALIALALAAATFLVYLPSLSLPLLDWDDPQYVAYNPVVLRGLTLDGVRWAFTTTHFSNWLPVTWLSHMLDCELFGTDPRGHHATSVVLHAANAALAFAVLRSMTGAQWRAAAVAALFSLHPLRVESVSWIAERKDVLAGTFFLLTLLAYARYVRGPSVGRYAVVAVTFALGLMSKTMLVTLPCVLLLLDYWPLARLRPGTAWRSAAGRLVLEKVPLFALSAAAVGWTVVLQSRGGATKLNEVLTLGQRLANAVVSVPRYLDKMARPVDLSAFYPYRTDWPAWQVAAAAALVLAVSALAVALARSRPYLFVGWFWFLGMLVPVSGIVQAGLQAMADRYTYLPSIGLLLAAAWAAADLCRSAPPLQRVLAPVVATLLAVLGFCTWLQQSYWSSTLDLFEHALIVEGDNWMAHLMVGTVKSAGGDEAAAIEHYSRAIERNPRHPNAWANRGNSYLRLGNTEQAIADLRQAVALQPTLAPAQLNLGIALVRRKSYEEAAAPLAEAARLEPMNPGAHYWWGEALLHLGRRRDAAERFAEALRLDPDHPSARAGLDRAAGPETAPAQP